MVTASEKDPQRHCEVPSAPPEAGKRGNLTDIRPVRRLLRFARNDILACFGLFMKPRTLDRQCLGNVWVGAYDCGHRVPVKRVGKNPDGKPGLFPICQQSLFRFAL